MKVEKTAVMAKGAVERQARLIFRRLGDAGARLQPIEGGDDLWGVFVPRNHFARPIIHVAQEYVSEFRRCDWLDRKSEGFLVLNDAGRAWYRRQAGGAEPYRAQHQLTARQTISLADGSSVPVTVNTGDSPLGWLRSRKDAQGHALLNNAQFDAGERFRKDFERARLMPSITSSWALPTGAKARRRNGARVVGDHLSESAIAAKSRVYSALSAVGPDLSGIVIEVCCNLSGLTSAERALGMPQRSGKVVLQIALNQLARHYGLLRDDRGQVLHQRLRHWGGEDYRPSIDG